MICIQNANAYFAGHTRGRQWNEFSGEQKDRAIHQARMDLSAALRRPLRDDEPPYREGDTIRDEYAVYEQAIYLLLRYELPEGRGELTPPPEWAKDPDNPRVLGGRFSLHAMSWLGERVIFSVRLA